jgi:imidazolonepropionase-like amidohydrolase
MIHAHRSHDIMNAIRLANEFEIDVVLDGGAESYRVIDELKAAEIPVIIHPQLIRMYGELENASFTTASKLADAGIPMAMQTGYESYVPKVRVLVFEAAQAAANGLGPHRALRACTIDAATLLGIDDRVGSLEVGKDADLALWDGDPFEWTTHCTGVIIDGQQVSTVVR